MQRRAISTGTIYGGVRTVTLLPGDGVGSEMAAAIKTIFRAAHVPIEFEQFDLTGVTNEKTSSKLDQALASIRKNKVALKGFWFTPVSRLSHKSWNGALRNELDVYASLSLVKNLPGPWPTRHKNVDFAIIRENTEGEYSGKEHSPVPGVVESLKVVTAFKTERIARKLGDGLFLNICRNIGKSYETFGIKTEDMIVDNASMQLVSKPNQFDVILCGNLYGNILSNVGAAIVGGPGLIPGANYGTDCAVFEPGCRHIGMGIQGQNTANPTGLLLSSLQMLNHLGLNDYSDKINNALNNVIREGRVLTPDVGGDHSTTDFTLQIISKLQ